VTTHDGTPAAIAPPGGVAPLAPVAQGDPITARQHNDMVAAINALAGHRGAVKGDFRQTRLHSTLRRAFIAKIVQESPDIPGRYSWIEQGIDTDNEYVDGELKGEVPSDHYAKEFNDGAGVPAGIRVCMLEVVSTDGTFEYRFYWPSGSSSSESSESSASPGEWFYAKVTNQASSAFTEVDAGSWENTANGRSGTFTELNGWKIAVDTIILVRVVNGAYYVDGACGRAGDYPSVDFMQAWNVESQAGDGVYGVEYTVLTNLSTEGIVNGLKVQRHRNQHDARGNLVKIIPWESCQTVVGGARINITTSNGDDYTIEHGTPGSSESSMTIDVPILGGHLYLYRDAQGHLVGAEWDCC
jgi:hypothetical protein